MRTYEALYIIAPNLDDDAIQAVVAGVENLITSNGGTIVRSEVWGRRKLAYEIKKHSEGVYVLLRFTASPEFVKKLDNHFKLAETVIRSMVLYLDERTLRLEAEQQHRREEEARIAATRVRGEGDDDDDDEDDEDDFGGGGRGRRRPRRDEDD